MPSLSIITPARVNNPIQLGWLQECLNSVQTQGFKDIEHIIVDDGSYVSLADYFRGIPNTLWLRFDEPIKPGAARNIAVKQASADYLFCLDADDSLVPNALQHLWDNRCPTKFIYGDIMKFDEAGNTSYINAEPYGVSPVQSLSSYGISALQPRWAWAHVGGLNEGLEGLEDVDYWVKLAEVGICGKKINALILNYRQHPESRTAQIYSSSAVVGLRDEIKRRHAGYFGGNIMPCASCPGEAVTGQVDVQVGSGEIALKYIGLRTASFFTPYSPVTNKRYRVPGRGQWLTIDVRDKAWVMSLGGNEPEYIEPVADIAPIPYQVQQQMTAPAALPTLNSMGQPEALALISVTTDKMDLRIFKAQEKARTQARKTVLEAIDQRMKELA